MVIFLTAVESVGDWCRPFVVGARHHVRCAQLENDVTLADDENVTRVASKTVLNFLVC